MITPQEIVVYLPYDVIPQQIEIVDQKVARSCKGALHFRPFSTHRITKGEYDYITNRKEFSSLVKKIKIIADIRLLNEKKESNKKKTIERILKNKQKNEHENNNKQENKISSVFNYEPISGKRDDEIVEKSKKNNKHNTN